MTDIITRARSGVARDGYSRELLYLPEPEAPTRLAKQLAQLGAALLAMGVSEAETWRLLRKAGWDSVPAVRCAVLECLSRRGKDEPATNAELQEETGLPQKTVERVVEDVVSLRLATREKVSNKWHVGLSPIARDYWDGERSPEKSEGSQNARGSHLLPGQVATEAETLADLVREFHGSDSLVYWREGRGFDSSGNWVEGTLRVERVDEAFGGMA